MKFREIAQHNRASLFIIIILLVLDIFVFISLYKFSLNIQFLTSELILLLSIFILMIYLSKGYNPSPLSSRKREIKNFLRMFSIGGGIYIIFNRIINDLPFEEMVKILTFSFHLLLTLIIIRLGVRWIQKLFLNAKIGLRNVIILGKGESSLNLINQLKDSPVLGYNVVGYVADRNDSNIDSISNYLGSLNHIQKISSLNEIDDIIISSSGYSHDEILNLIGKLYNLSICIKIIPDMYEALTGKVRMSVLYGLPLIDINPDILTEYQQFIKRLIDILMSIILLVALLPLSIFSVLTIKFTSSGSTFYIQRRVGKNNEPFKLFKFRTMFENSETESGPVWASVDDPRITPIGRLLRKFRIDEIPQLLNVLKGDMSIVGPRPERPFFVEKLTTRFPYYSRRLCLRPGITGWAQVVGNYDTTVENVQNKLKHDFYYIENISMLLDIKIMFMTLIILVKGRGR